MTIINKTYPAHQHENNNNRENNELSFDDRVLQFIRDNKPEGTLNELLKNIKSLDPEKKYSLQQLNKALLYSDATLRRDPDYEAYTTGTLDKNTTQMLGVNMLVNNMMNGGFLSTDEKEEDFL